MSLNRWKVLACTLTVGVGGLAVFATPPASNKTDAPKEPAPLPELTVKPTSPANGTDTPPPAKPAKAEEFDLVVPDPIVAPAAPTKADEPVKRPATEPVFEPVTPPAPVVLPAGGTEVKDLPKPDDKKPDASQLPAVVVPPPSKPEIKDLGKPEAGNRFVIIRYDSEAAFDKFWNGGGKAWIEKYAPQARSVRVEGVEQK